MLYTVPYNGPVCVFMVLATSSWGIALGNWVNQSQNALVNYCNRNASSPTTTGTLVRSYCGAVGASLVVSIRTLAFACMRRQSRNVCITDDRPIRSRLNAGAIAVSRWAWGWRASSRVAGHRAHTQAPPAALSLHTIVTAHADCTCNRFATGRSPQGFCGSPPFRRRWSRRRSTVS